MTKFALLAAASVAAIVMAGAAQAGTVTGTINGVAVDPQNAVTASRTIYTIASERTDAADTTGVGAAVLINALGNKPSIAVGAPAQSYQVTFTVAGGTIPTGSAAALTVNQTAVGTTPPVLGTASVVQGARDANSITFIVTVNAPTGGAPGAISPAATVDGFTLTGVLANSAAEAAITIGGSTSVLAGGVASVIDTTSGATVVRYASAVGSPTVTSNAYLAALPNFLYFQGVGAAPVATSLIAGSTTIGRTAQVASNYLYTAVSTNNSGTAAVPGTPVFFAGLAAATTIASTGIVNGGTVTVTGALLDKLTPTLVGVTSGNITTSTITATAAVLVLNDAGADEFVAGTTDLSLTQTATVANQVALQAGSYSTAFAPTYAAGYTAPAAVTLTSGTIGLDGVNLMAPWVGGSQAGTKSVIRLSNGGAASSGNVTLRLNNALARAAGVTTGAGAAIANQVCATTFAIPNTGDLQIGQNELKACFGDFLRGDVQITIQSAATSLTGKMRQVEADGSTYESSLGRFSGATIAEATF